MALVRGLASRLDRGGGVLAAQGYDALNFLLSNPAILLKKLLAYFFGPRTDRTGLPHQPLRFARWVEDSIAGLIGHAARAFLATMTSENRHRFRVQDLNLQLIEPDPYLREQRSGQCGVIALPHLDQAVIPHGAPLLLEVAEGHDGKRF